LHRYCDKAASACQVDHIVPVKDGGLSTQENGRLLCASHNRPAYRAWLARDPETRAALIACRQHRHDDEEQSDEAPEQSALEDRGPPAS
jgi:hypothetical protein